MAAGATPGGELPVPDEVQGIQAAFWRSPQCPTSGRRRLFKFFGAAASPQRAAGRGQSSGLTRKAVTLDSVSAILAAALTLFAQPAEASDECVRLKSFREGEPTIQEIFLKPARPFGSDSVRKCGIGWAGDRKANKGFEFEQGTYKKLQYVTFYGDGGGRMQGAPDMDFFSKPDLQHSSENWSITCPVRYKAVDDQWCALWKRDLRITLSQAGAYRFLVGVRDRGATNVSVRVDAQPAIEAPSNDQITAEQVSELLRQLKQGKQVTTAFTNSSGKVETRKQSLFGVNEALDWLAWTVTSIAADRKPVPPP